MEKYPNPDVEIWKTIYTFPKYSVGSYGRVRRDSSQRVIKPQHNEYGVVTVGLMNSEGVQCQRSLTLLVASAFVPGRTQVFDTPICLDGDRDNNICWNLTWRPRWFAVKYNRQFKHPYGYPIRRPIRNLRNHEWFPNSIECAKTYGLLEQDLCESIRSRTYVWPTYQEFEVVHITH